MIYIYIIFVYDIALESLGLFSADGGSALPFPLDVRHGKVTCFAKWDVSMPG